MHKTSYNTKQTKTQTGKTQNKLQIQTSDTEIKQHTQNKLQPKTNYNQNQSTYTNKENVQNKLQTHKQGKHKTSYKHNK